MKKRRWTAEEVALMETLTPHYTAREAMQWFPGATAHSLSRAAYLRGMAWRRAISSPSRATPRRPPHSPEFVEAVRQLWEDTDMTAEKIGAEVGLTKNAVVGLAYRQNWRVRGVLGDRGMAKTTLAERMDALNAMMDRVLAENPPGRGRIQGSGD